MLLRKRPTYFVKGDDRRKAFYTVQARELIERGYVEESTVSESTEKPDKTPEIPVVVGEDAYETVTSVLEEDYDVDLNSMKKSELLDYAAALGVHVESAWLKAEIIKAIESAE